MIHGKKIMKLIGRYAGLLSLLLSAGITCADENKNNLLLTGTLVEPPACTLNGGNTVEVSFGEQIGIKKVEQGIYRQSVDLGLDCESSDLGWQLTLMWTGNAAGFDSENATIRSEEQAGLGVKMYAGAQPLELNTVLKVNSNTLPDLEAVLVQQEGSELDEGSFKARGTFRIEYQ